MFFIHTMPSFHILQWSQSKLATYKALAYCIEYVSAKVMSPFAELNIAKFKEMKKSCKMSQIMQWAVCA